MARKSRARPLSYNALTGQDEAAERFCWHLRVLAPDLPVPSREHEFDAVRHWRFDLAFPSERVSIECDGGQWKAGGGRHNTDEDRFKINSATAAGWLVLRFSLTAMDNDPTTCVALVRQALALRNSSGGSDG